MYRFPRTANEQSEHRQNRPQEPSPPSHVEIVNTSKSHPGDAEHVSIVEPSIAPHTKQRTVTARYKGLITYCPNSKCKQGKLKTTVHTSPLSVNPDTPESKKDDLRIRVHLHVERRKIRHKHRSWRRTCIHCRPSTSP